MLVINFSCVNWGFLRIWGLLLLLSYKVESNLTNLLTYIRNNITNIGRDTLVTLQDIINIRKQYISHIQKNSTDGMSNHTVQLIETNEDQAQIYAYFKMVQMETDTGIFNRKLQQFLAFLQLKHKQISW